MAQDLIYLKGTYHDHNLGGWYPCKNLDEVGACITLESNMRLRAINAGEYSDDEDELMGSAPHYWNISKDQFVGTILVDIGNDKQLTLEVNANYVHQVTVV